MSRSKARARQPDNPHGQSPKARLEEYLRTSDGVGQAGVEDVSKRFDWVFKSPDAPALVGALIELTGLQSSLFETLDRTRFWLGWGVDATAMFLRHSPTNEVARRFKALSDWMSRVNTQNFDGVTLTPVLIGHLAQARDVEEALAELDRLRDRTLSGVFDWSHPLQRDLEFKRFVSEQNDLGPPEALHEMYRRFYHLKELPPAEEATYELTGKELLEVKRAAYETAVFLQFLRRFRAQTERPVVVVGNYRYGRHWIVEPLEKYLTDGFEVRYYRVPSHKSMRLTVPHYLERQIISGFPPEFVKQLNIETPHVVIADVCSPSRTDGVSKFSRALRDYVNWFMVFNDIRAQGDESVYEQDSSMPPGHLPSLKRWHHSVLVRRQLQEWVTPGPTYKVAHWAPELKETVLMGDARVPTREADPSDGKPLVVVANPAIYRTEGDDLPDILRNTEPYYFNDPEKHVPDNIVLGYSDYGVETRVVGPTTDQFVAAVQRHIQVEVTNLIESGRIEID